MRTALYVTPNGFIFRAARLINSKLFTLLCFLGIITTTASSLLPSVTSNHEVATRHHKRMETFQTFTDRTNFAIRVTATTCASITLCAALITFFWFFRMEKVFRIRLIMMLIAGDLLRSVWYFVYAVVSFMQGASGTNTPLCQTSGFLIQVGTEMTDLSILAIAVHGTLQIFLPQMSRSQDGLYPWRHWVFGLILALPVTTAIVPVVVPPHIGTGYMAQGPFCSLPIRPYWFRLTLAWVPRYCICGTIIILASSIYWHVRRKYLKYNAIKPRLQTSNVITPQTSHERKDLGQVDTAGLSTNSGSGSYSPLWSWGRHNLLSTSTHPLRRASDTATLINAKQSITVSPSSSPFNTDRRPSAVSAASTSPARLLDIPFASGKHHRTSSTEHELICPLTPIPGRKASVASEPTHTCRQIVTPFAPRPALLSRKTAPVHTLGSHSKDGANESLPFNTSPKGSNSNTNRLGADRRKNDLRQLRSLFIYPLVYMLLWVFPFISMCMMYTDRWAESGPPFFIVILAVICITSMGAVDCVIFSIRERPWRHVRSRPLSSEDGWPRPRNQLPDAEQGLAARSASGRHHRRRSSTSCCLEEETESDGEKKIVRLFPRSSSDANAAEERRKSRGSGGSATLRIVRPALMRGAAENDIRTGTTFDLSGEVVGACGPVRKEWWNALEDRIGPPTPD